MDKQYNLIDEPWLLVMQHDHTTAPVSIRELFTHAHEYRSLAGELPTQDVALLRLLLAILYAVFLRRDVDGTLAPLTAEGGARAKTARKRWTELWKQGRFPMEVIGAYLDSVHERFWLFHPERPFYQVAGMNSGTAYGAAKLNGVLSESTNKKRLFTNVNGQAKESLSFAEAARWLPYVIAFDDTSSKPKQKGLPSPGAGWLGKLGLIYAQGETLFQTLMLNLALLKDGTYLWEDSLAPWELPEVRTQEREEIPLPSSPIALYTLQSRRICLTRDADRVTGYLLLGGDFFPKENAYSEQMTFWSPTSDKNKVGHQPKRHQQGKQLWREFATFIGQKNSENGHLPGIVQWLTALRYDGIIQGMTANCRIASVQYGDKDFFVTDVFEDQLSFSIDLLSELGDAWCVRVKEEVSLAEELAGYLGWLADDLEKAGGSVPEAAQVREDFYYQIDMPFRAWLQGIDPVRDTDLDAVVRVWRRQERRILHSLGRKLVDQAGSQAFVGRILTDKKTKKDVLYCAPNSYDLFCARVGKRIGGDAHEE